MTITATAMARTTTPIQMDRPVSILAFTYNPLQLLIIVCDSFTDYNSNNGSSTYTSPSGHTTSSSGGKK